MGQEEKWLESRLAAWTPHGFGEVSRPTRPMVVLHQTLRPAGISNRIGHRILPFLQVRREYKATSQEDDLPSIPDEAVLEH
jgi:hypothetical protein